MKVCKKCEREKEATAEFFQRNKRRKDGLESNCKECNKNWQLLKDREYKKNNRERVRLNGRNQYRKAGFRSKIKTSKASAAKHGFEFRLIEQDLIDQFNKQQGLCYYTNLPMDMEIGSNDWNVVSIDRIDSDIGYVPSNIVLCRKIANFMKNTLSIDQFKYEIVELSKCLVTQANVGYTLAGT